jgi:hypothetical protein
LGISALAGRGHRDAESRARWLPLRTTRRRLEWGAGRSCKSRIAEQRLRLLAGELDRTWPDAAGSLNEGLHDTLTPMGLGITGQLAKTISSTNPCESMIEIVRHT